MFTGIVEEVGRVTAVERRDNGLLLTIAASHVVGTLIRGASIAVDGVCQTVLQHDARGFQVAAEAETLRVTTLGRLQPGMRVNLERALPADGRFDGHIMLGHVDGTARVTVARQDGRTQVLGLETDTALASYVVPKGCIAVDGVSLTVGPDVRGGRFELYLIPHTWEHTALGDRRPGDAVNIETDILVRTVAHLLGGQAAAGGTGAPGARAADGITWDALQRAFGKQGA
jgi:riboflavin synthase